MPLFNVLFGVYGIPTWRIKLIKFPTTRAKFVGFTARNEINRAEFKKSTLK